MSEPPKVSLNADIKANVLGKTRGTDLSSLGLAGLSLIGAIGCFWLSTRTPWALFGALAFLGCFGYVLHGWKEGTHARAQVDAPPATLSWKSGDEEIAVAISLDERNYVAKKILSGMRTVIQSRQLPPTPRGAVAGNPADSGSLKEYSPEQQRELEAKWAEEIPKHDELVVERLTSKIKELEANSTIQDDEKTSPGLPQKPEDDRIRSDVKD